MISISIDERKFRKGIIAVKGGLSAARATISHTGTGEVFTGRRPPSEDDFDFEHMGMAKATPSWQITRYLRAKGFDPFALPEDKKLIAYRVLEKGIKTAVVRSYKTGIPSKNRAVAAIAEATNLMRDEVKKDISEGNLKKNSNQYTNRKRRYVQRRLIRSLGGRTPPYGVLTGRWLEAISSRWRPGSGK